MKATSGVNKASDNTDEECSCLPHGDRPLLGAGEFALSTPSVILLEFQLGSGLFIAEEPGILVHLKRGSRAVLGKATFNGSGDSGGLVLSERKKNNLLGLHDGADTHRESVLRNIRRLLEEAGVILDRLRGEGNHARTRSERRTRLVERNVTIGTDSENLNVNAAGLLDLSLVRRALLAPILCETVQDMGIGLLDVDEIEKVLFKELLKV